MAQRLETNNQPPMPRRCTPTQAQPVQTHPEYDVNHFSSRFDDFLKKLEQSTREETATVLTALNELNNRMDNLEQSQQINPPINSSQPNPFRDAPTVHTVHPLTGQEFRPPTSQLPPPRAPPSFTIPLRSTGGHFVQSSKTNHHTNDAPPSMNLRGGDDRYRARHN